MTKRIPAPRVLAAIAALALLAAAGCGDGSVGSGGTGAPMGITLGTVNGFGSVIVDGKRYDDSMVPTLREIGPGVQTRTRAALGSHLTVAHDGAGAVTAVDATPALSGPVAALNSSGFVLLGQTVIVNGDPARGPVTQFGAGYANASSVRAGDPVDVQGFVVRQASGFVVQATRIDPLASPPPYLQVTGLVSGMSTSGFQLGTLAVATAGAAVRPAGSVIANGETVTVMALPASLTLRPNGDPQFAAAQVRVRQIGSAGDAISVGGAIAALDRTASTFDLGGLSVAFGASKVVPSTAALGDGRYVRVQGRVAADGSVQASDVTLLDGSVEPEAELLGNIVGYDAASRSFTVRGTLVDARSAQIVSCPASGLADGLYVDIEGSLGSNGVVAAKVQCEAEPKDATVERHGSASAVDAVALTFVLTTSNSGPIPVRWTTSTFFNGTTPASMAGHDVEIEGKFDASGVLVAQSISIDD